MRVADTIAHPSMRIIIYTLEKHYYVEYEAGPMKQGFRFSKEQMGSLDGLKNVVDQAFHQQVEKRFHEMHKQAMEAVRSGEQWAVSGEWWAKLNIPSNALNIFPAWGFSAVHEGFFRVICEFKASHFWYHQW